MPLNVSETMAIIIATIATKIPIIDKITDKSIELP